MNPFLEFERVDESEELPVSFQERMEEEDPVENRNCYLGNFSYAIEEENPNSLFPSFPLNPFLNPNSAFTFNSQFSFQNQSFSKF